MRAVLDGAEMTRGKIDRMSRIGEKMTVVAMGSAEQKKRVRDAVARRAYEIFKRRGGMGRHQAEDCRQAETELLEPFCGGEMPVNEGIWFGTDPAAFEKGTIEIWVAPRQMTICGKRRAEADASRPSALSQADLRTYRVVSLPAEVDPTKVTTKIKGPTASLEIVLFSAKRKACLEVKSAA